MPVSDCEVRDPRIRRTRQSLKDALRILLQSRSLEDISVQDLAEAAGVNRATFYDHYADKFALLDALIAGGFHQLVHDRGLRYEPNSSQAAEAIILAVCDYFTLMRDGHPDCRGKGPFDPLVDAAIVGAIRRVITRSNGESGGSSPLLSEMAATAASSAIYGAVKEWFSAPGHPPAQEIAPEILEFVLPMLQVESAHTAVAR